MTAITDRIAAVPPLTYGKHMRPDDGMCLLEAVSWVSGEPFSDHPNCVCPVLGAFGRAWNDALNDEDRNRLLTPFIPRLVGTRSTRQVEDRRAWMACDWLIRTYTPAWLRLANLAEQADALANAAEIRNRDDVTAVRPLINRAVTAAGDAAWDAAWAAAWAAAGDAAGAAAGAAVRAAAWAAAGYAAWAAAGDAAWDAAWDAAVAAAGAAARDALRPTTLELQASAVDLFTRMIEVRS